MIVDYPGHNKNVPSAPPLTGVDCMRDPTRSAEILADNIKKLKRAESRRRNSLDSKCKPSSLHMIVDYPGNNDKVPSAPPLAGADYMHDSTRSAETLAENIKKLKRADSRRRFMVTMDAFISILAKRKRLIRDVSIMLMIVSMTCIVMVVFWKS